MDCMEKIEKQFKLTLKEDPNDANTHSNYGLFLCEMNRTEEAEEQFILSLKANPNNAYNHSNYGVFLRSINRIEKAEEQFILSLKSELNDAILHLNYGNFLREIGRMEEAEEQFILALGAESNFELVHASTYYNYAILLQEMNRADEAEKQYRLTLEAEPDNAVAYLNYGNLLQEINRTEEAEIQYKLSLKYDPNHAATHYNYAILLQKMNRNQEAEEQYRLFLESKPNDVNAHSNYGNLLRDIGRAKEAEEQYKLALEAKPDDAITHSNYGILLYYLGRMKEAEEHFIFSLETEPNKASAHYNYAIFLTDIELMEDAEIQYKFAIELEPENPDNHCAYSLFLILMNLEEDAIEEMMAASRLYREKGEDIKEHLVLAWLYEDLANKYYSCKKYQESGQYSEVSGNEYIEAGKRSGDKFKGIFLTKGYTLKGRAKVRKLTIQSPCNTEMFMKIMYDINDASKYYKNAAEASPENNICNACSLSMKCLSEILNYMLAVTKQEKVPKLKGKIEEWKENLDSCEKIYEGSEKGENFIRSLYKMMRCVENLEECKQFATWEEEKNFKECINDLIEIAINIEGPLQRLIEDSARQMNQCKSKIIHYRGAESKPFAEIDGSQELKSKCPVEFENDSHYTSVPNRFSGLLNWISEHIIGAAIASIIATVIGGIILNILQRKYLP